MNITTITSTGDVPSGSSSSYLDSIVRLFRLPQGLSQTSLADLETYISDRLEFYTDDLNVATKLDYWYTLRDVGLFILADPEIVGWHQADAQENWDSYFIRIGKVVDNAKERIALIEKSTNTGQVRSSTISRTFPITNDDVEQPTSYPNPNSRSYRGDPRYQIRGRIF